MKMFVFVHRHNKGCNCKRSGKCLALHPMILQIEETFLKDPKQNHANRKKGRTHPCFLIRLSEELLRVLRGQNTLHGDELLLDVSSIPFQFSAKLDFFFFPNFF